jgi:hypothetical protein
MNCQRNVNSILLTQLPHKFSYIVARFIHNYFESQSDWFDSQFHNQLSNDICACRQINWNRNKITMYICTTFVGQIAKQHKSKGKCNFILIYWIEFFQIFLQIFEIFFSIENKKKASSKYVAPFVSYDRECIQKL